MGSDISLTCNVELSSAIEIPVNVNVIWTGPNEFMTTQTVQKTAAVHGTTNFSVTTTINSFEGTQSGNYTCTASIHSTSVFLNASQSVSTTLMVTTGKD